MNIQDILSTKAVDQVTEQHLAIMDSLINQGKRAEAYIYYAKLSNLNVEQTNQLMLQAQITTYSGVIGGAALEGNYGAKVSDPENYNLSLDQFTVDIEKGLVSAIRADIESGNSGRITQNQIQNADQAVWASKGMYSLFPGNYQTHDNINAIDTNNLKDYLLAVSALEGSGLGKLQSEFSSIEYDSISDNGYTLYVSKKTGVVEGVFPESGPYAVANKFYDSIGLSEARATERDAKWSFLGANGKEFDPNAIAPEYGINIVEELNDAVDEVKGAADYLSYLLKEYFGAENHDVDNSLLDIDTHTTQGTSENSHFDPEQSSSLIDEGYLEYDSNWYALSTDSIVNDNGIHNTLIGDIIGNGLRPGNHNLNLEFDYGLGSVSSLHQAVASSYPGREQRTMERLS
ncbi:hypothetical protein [Endozoicomonas sp. ALD040]|uniref:hypothetical protein n=1 Tax=Endozoicomonas sp. ALD040 TaxID=3403079 RepID=UPI003BB15891